MNSMFQSKEDKWMKTFTFRYCTLGTLLMQAVATFQVQQAFHNRIVTLGSVMATTKLDWVQGLELHPHSHVFPLNVGKIWAAIICYLAWRAHSQTQDYSTAHTVWRNLGQSHCKIMDRTFSVHCKTCVKLITSTSLWIDQRCCQKWNCKWVLRTAWRDTISTAYALEL